MRFERPGAESGLSVNGYPPMTGFDPLRTLRVAYRQPLRPTPGQMVTRFRVVRATKGETRRTWQIAHHVEGATCGVVFQPGKEYVVIAGAWQSRMSTGLCQQAQFSLAEYEVAARR